MPLLPLAYRRRLLAQHAHHRHDGEVHAVFLDLFLKHPDDQLHLHRAEEAPLLPRPAGPARARVAFGPGQPPGRWQQVRGREPVAMLQGRRDSDRSD